jgi:hypothetical protein
VFSGQTMYAQGASLDGNGIITTSTNYCATVMW